MRLILHSDLNNFYASVECLKHPEYRNLPLVVTGNKEDRHGIVLAKNMTAKKAGIKTGDVYWLAKQKCGNLIEITADFPSYLQMSKAVRKIYEDYTDRVEAFGIDECWLDLTGTSLLFGDGKKIAEEIRNRVKSEYGLTVSVGVSWNKIFAKFGSDMKKPDAVTVITPENYKSLIWRLPAEELLYVGPATKRKLNEMNIFTVGDLAEAEESLLINRLGKWGSYLHEFANGRDRSPVRKIGEEENVKSIGNSMTNYRDLENEEEIRLIFYMLAESVAARMREAGLPKARVVSMSVRASDLSGFGKRRKLPYPTGNAADFAEAAMTLFRESYSFDVSVRGIGLSVSDFVTGSDQMNFFTDFEREEKELRLAKALDRIRGKYGNTVVQRAIVYKDRKLADMDVKGEHVIHPYSFFK